MRQHGISENPQAPISTYKAQVERRLIEASRGGPVRKLLAHLSRRGYSVMSLVRLVGFTTLRCGCVIGKYRELATSRVVAYVEEKGKGCGTHDHRRNHTVVVGSGMPMSPAPVSKAS
jgi:hypothetical protein